MAPGTTKAGRLTARNTPGSPPPTTQPGPEPQTSSSAWSGPAAPSTQPGPAPPVSPAGPWCPSTPPPAWPGPPRPPAPPGGAHQLGAVHALHEILVLGLALAAGAGLSQAVPALHPLPLEGVTGPGLAIGLRRALPQQPPVHIDAQLPLQLPERHGSAPVATPTRPGTSPSLTDPQPPPSFTGLSRRRPPSSATAAATPTSRFTAGRLRRSRETSGTSGLSRCSAPWRDGGEVACRAPAPPAGRCGSLWGAPSVLPVPPPQCPCAPQSVPSVPLPPAHPTLVPEGPPSCPGSRFSGSRSVPILRVHGLRVPVSPHRSTDLCRNPPGAGHFVRAEESSGTSPPSDTHIPEPTPLFPYPPQNPRCPSGCLNSIQALGEWPHFP